MTQIEAAKTVFLPTSRSRKPNGERTRHNTLTESAITVFADIRRHAEAGNQKTEKERNTEEKKKQQYPKRQEEERNGGRKSY